jgi:membrane-associated phospholipid phosphatase
VLALARRRWSLLVLVALADAIADGLAALLKVATDVHRPTGTHPLLALPHSNSFPSGHTATSFACATVLTAFAPRAAPAFYVLALAVAYSRLYVGVHFPTDVAAGAALGIATALLLLAAARRRSARALRSG